MQNRDARKTTKMKLPYGFFYKRLTNGKYSNFVEFHDEVADHISFSNFVRNEAAEIENITDRHQLHFKPNEGDDGVYAIAVEVGNFTNFSQMVNEDPSIVARKNFINDTIHDLIDFTELLNSHDIYHVCFAPDNVLARKGDSTIRLLCHGSFYQKLDQEALYNGYEDFVAPEVLNSGQIDARSDVYSLGCFIAWLYQTSGMPFELKSVIAKATAADPDTRYASVADLRQAINARHAMRSTGLMGLAALVIALAIVGCYFYLLPSPDDIEFVKPVEEPIPDELMEEDPLLFGLGAEVDSLTLDSIVKGKIKANDSIRVDDHKMREYQAKAEAIFRKQFTRAADEILNKVYNKEKMNMTEKDFMVKSKAMTKELAKKEQELGQKANLSDERSQRIASEIIDQLTNKKMQELDKDYMGLRKKADPDEDKKKEDNTKK